MIKFSTQLAAIVKEWDKVISLITPHGKSLSERVVLSEEEGAFDLLFQGDDELVYGYFKREKPEGGEEGDGPLAKLPSYHLQVQGGVVFSCDCNDAEDRGRLCKHSVWLALLSEFDLPCPPRTLTASTIPPAALKTHCGRLPAPAMAVRTTAPDFLDVNDFK